MPPRSKNGSKISSLVSLNTRDGGGSVEPARRQASSQNSINNASTTNGGTTRIAVSRAILIYFSARGGRFGVIATTGAAVVAGTMATGSLFIAGMFIESVSPCSMDGTERERAVPLRSNVNTLDGQRLQIRRRIFRIEYLAIEEGFLAARGGGRGVRGGDAEFLRGVLPEVFAVDLGDQRLGVVARFIFPPADILGEEPQIVA